jgi:valyl-tRNA synthetase
MQPHLAPAIERATRKQFPDGIAAYGTDALRFTFAALATQSRDLRFDLGRVEGYRNFCNKLWNASRYVLMATEASEGDGPVELSVADRWINSRLDAAVRAVHDAFRDYRLDLAAQAAYEFTWYEFCDWYLELSKAVLQSESASAAQRRGTRQTLTGTLEALLRLLHPLMPFITEEIWQRVGPLAGSHGETIMRQPFPMPSADRADAAVEADMRWTMDFILGIRQIRGEMDIAPSVRFDVLLQDASAGDLERYAAYSRYIDRLANVAAARPLAAGEAPPQSAAALLGDMKILVPMAGLIDVEAELTRLAKRRAKVAQEVLRAEGKLGNARFIDNAPAEIVEQERTRIADFKRELEQLDAQLERVASLR